MAIVAPQSLTLGTMRLDPERHSLSEWAAFFIYAHRLGVRSVHVSDEYESWPLFLEIWDEVRRIAPTQNFKFIAKLGEPHFDQAEFSAERFLMRVEKYCSQLSIDRLHDVQWMWRSDLQRDDLRCSTFTKQSTAIRDTVALLKKNDRIERFLCFPYSPVFCDLALAQDFVDGLTVYRNSQEQEYETQLDQCAARSKMAHIIRPFLGGNTLENSNLTPRQQLIEALSHPAIETAILSTGNIEHLHEFLN